MKVTRKEAIKVFNDMKKGIYPYDPNVYLDIAINSLEIDERYELEYENAEEIHREKEQAYMQGYEDACKKYRQEPCRDAVSRMAINNLRKYILVGGISTVSLIDVNKLPSVNPQESKTGHWIDIDATHSQCDRCGAVFEIASANGEANYCPNCGAKMAESEDKECV